MARDTTIPMLRLARRLSMAALAAGLAALTGCSGTASPKAGITSARLRDRSPEAVVVEFVIEADNPNDIELPMRDVVYTLSIEGRRVFSGRRQAMATIPRGGSQTVVIPAVIPLGEEGVTADLHRYTLRGTVYYSLPSQLADVLFDANLSRPSVAISDEGEIDLR